MKLRWKILIGMGIFLVLAAASLTVTMHVQPENEVEAYKKMLRDKGEKLEISEVLPAPVPDESNGMSQAEMAFGAFDPGAEDYTNLPPAMVMVGPGRAMVGSAQPQLALVGIFTNSWEIAAAMLDSNRPALDLLAQAANYPALDFHLEYSNGPAMLLKHLISLKHASQELSATAVFRLHHGDPATAAANICTLLSLVEADHAERTVISQLVRCAISSIGLAATWEMLQATNLDGAQLASVQRRWEQLHFIENTEGALLMERASSEHTIQEMRESKGSLGLYLGGPSSSSGGAGASGDFFESLKETWDDAKEAGSQHIWRSSWSYSDELLMLQVDQIILDAVRAIANNQIFNPAYSNMLAQLDVLGVTNLPASWMIKLDFPDYRRVFSGDSEGLANFLKRILNAEAGKRVAITAIALKRYQLKNGKWPENLGGLAPAFLSSIPLDPVDGKPLRYRCNEDGTYVLYSIGEDGVDDGGDVTPTASTSSSTVYLSWQRARDWVWPQPATEAEVQNFYEHPPK